MSGDRETESLIKTKCENCRNIYAVPVYAIGRSIKCKKCSVDFIATKYLIPTRKPIIKMEPTKKLEVRLVSGIAIASLSLGTVACVTGWLSIFQDLSFAVSLMGMVFGVIGLIESWIGKRSYPDLAGAGLFVSFVAMLIVILSMGMGQ